MLIDPRFFYRADASGVSAIITHTPFERYTMPRYINVRGASSLPQIGGLSQQSFGPESIPNELQPVLRFRHVLTSAFGREMPDAFVTDVVAEASELQVGNDEQGVVFKADLLHARLQSIHPKDPQQQPQITWKGTSFTNVRLVERGQEFRITVQLDHDLEQLVTEETIVARYAEDPKKYSNKFFRVRPSPDEGAPRELPPDEPPPPEVPRAGKNKYILCSLVESLTTEYQGAKPIRHILDVPNFGRIFFGEVTIGHDTRALTLIRFTLGSPFGAESSVCSVRSNGEPVTS